MAVFCLYKTYGLPDGAALVVRGGPAVAAPPPGGLALGPLARHQAAWLAARSPTIARVLASAQAATGDARPYDPAADFAVDEHDRGISATSLRLLGRLADPAAAAIRRGHYRVLADALGEAVPPPFDAMTPGASPFVLPVSAPDKAALLRWLATAGVQALDFWSVAHPALDAERFPGAARRRATTVGLPVHQELRPADVERIAAVSAPAWRARGPALRVEPLDDFDAAPAVWDELAVA